MTVFTGLFLVLKYKEEVISSLHPRLCPFISFGNKQKSEHLEALAGVAQWIERGTAKLRVVGGFPVRALA